MLRVHHGRILPLELDGAAIADTEILDAEPQTWPFGFMFEDLQDDPQNLLEESEDTVENLRRLGEKAMKDPGVKKIPGVPIPAIHNFFGQFVDHDITLERGSAHIKLDNPTPLSLDEIREQIRNSRSPNLDLDNVYGPNIEGDDSPHDPIDDRKMRIDEVAPSKGLPPGKTDRLHDLPRLDDGTPLIGDERNDENIITAQLHVAFLRAHNAIVDKKDCDFEEARKQLIQHYQWIVLDDFLERIADPNIVKAIRFKGPKFFDEPAESFYMPLEFSLAVYRFGHSKVRPSYDQFNEIQKTGGLDLLFTFAGRRLPDDWVIQWPSFLEPENKRRVPRPIDTSLSRKLLRLGPLQLNGGEPEANLAVRNLLRGYILRLPTGQAVAKAMESQGILPMTPDQIYAAAQEIPHQQDVLMNTKFLTETPLWFYILAEAKHYSRGHHLGPVGSTIVAEVLIGVLRNSTFSILSDPQWIPTLGDTPGKFDLEDLLKLAGVL